MLPMQLSKVRFALVGALSLLATASLAQTIQVGPGQPYTTIQAGINAAAVNGDTRPCRAGHVQRKYSNFNGKAITVTSSGGAAVTIIDGGYKPGIATVTFAN